MALLKKLLFGLGLVSVSCVGAIALAQGNSFLSNPATNGEEATPDGLPGLGSETINVPQTTTDKVGEGILDAIKRVINYVLGLLALVVLVLFIYGGLLVIFGATSDDAQKKAFTIIKNAAIGLAIIAFARLLVSFIFFVLDAITAGPGSTGTGG